MKLNTILTVLVAVLLVVSIVQLVQLLEIRTEVKSNIAGFSSIGGGAQTQSSGASSLPSQVGGC